MKQELLRGLYHELGVKADDWLESTQARATGLRGGAKALRDHAKKTRELVNVVKADLEKGKLEGLEPIEVADYAILMISRAADGEVLEGDHLQAAAVAANGEVQAYTKMVQYLKGQHDLAVANARALKEAIANGDVVEDENGDLVQVSGRRLSGVRPAPSDVQKRKAEAKKAKKAKKDTKPKKRKPKKKKDADS